MKERQCLSVFNVDKTILSRCMMINILFLSVNHKISIKNDFTKISFDMEIHDKGVLPAFGFGNLVP